MVGDRKTSEPLKIWLAEACVSSLADGSAPDDPGSSRECTNESDEPCFSERRGSSSRRFRLRLRPLALKLRRPPSMLSLLKSTLRLPKFFKSILLRNASELARLNSVLARGLVAPIGDRVALTLSPNNGASVRMGVGGVGVDLLSLLICKDVRFEAPPFGLCMPSLTRGAGGFSMSSGTCCAVVSSTKIRSTFNASLPKLKKEKKY